MTREEIDAKVIGILEPHYWNQGCEDGKEGARKSVTYRNLMQLIDEYTAEKVLEARIEELRMAGGYDSDRDFYNRSDVLQAELSKLKEDK